jgi:hypothetical protein
VFPSVSVSEHELEHASAQHYSAIEFMIANHSTRSSLHSPLSLRSAARTAINRMNTPHMNKPIPCTHLFHSRKAAFMRIPPRTTFALQVNLMNSPHMNALSTTPGPSIHVRLCSCGDTHRPRRIFQVSVFRNMNRSTPQCTALPRHRIHDRQPFNTLCASRSAPCTIQGGAFTFISGPTRKGRSAIGISAGDRHH